MICFQDQGTGVTLRPSLPQPRSKNNDGGWRSIDTPRTWQRKADDDKPPAEVVMIFVQDGVRVVLGQSRTQYCKTSTYGSYQGSLSLPVIVHVLAFSP